MSVIERWTIYEGIEGTHGIWTERGDHPGWKGKLRGKFRRVVVVPEDQLAGAVDRVAELERKYDALRWIFKREVGRAPTAAEFIEARRELGGSR